MKRNLDISAYILLAVGAAVGSYFLGYYQGVCACSVKAASYQLATDEDIYQKIHIGESGMVNSDLKVFISGDSKSLRMLKDDPLSYFEYELFTAKAGDIPKLLEKADEISKE